uniref:DRBM domain-containing protein n=1 Tax=Tetradesmus obliquus TaxID=3088 RepID=A0A383VNY6_TETOB|eukprot:jgi/Sobl393_1/8157/SZX66126.1
MQLQQGLHYTAAAAATTNSSSTQQQAAAPSISCINQLTEFLLAHGRGGFQVTYSDAARVPGTPDHRPQWTVYAQLLQMSRSSSSSSSSSSSTNQLTAAGTGPTRSGAKHAAAAAMLLHEDFASLFAGSASATAALSAAAAAANAAATPVPQADGAAAVARARPVQPADVAAAAAAAAAPNYKNRLQELMQKAASKRLLGYDGWGLPTYSTKRSFEGQPTMFTSTVTLHGPTGPCSLTGSQPHPSKKEAEQHAAQLMLQQLQPDMLAAQEQQAGVKEAGGLQAALQGAAQQVQVRE